MIFRRYQHGLMLTVVLRPHGRWEQLTMTTTSSSTPSALMSLLLPQESQKQVQVWLGDGLPSIPQKLHDHMLQWEFIDFAELKPTGTLDKLTRNRLVPIHHSAWCGGD